MADQSSNLKLLLEQGGTPHPTSLEDYIAYAWAHSGNLLGLRHGVRRDGLTLAWLRDAVLRAPGPRRVLDVGCSYGNHLFMLNAMLGKPSDVEMVGVDLFETGIRRANAFAAEVAGYTNCSFEVADLSAGLPFENETFAAINLADVLEHMVDPRAALSELRRVAQPGATLVISTPLKDGLFKRAAAGGNRLLRGRVYQAYYSGKRTQLDNHGQPVMKTFAGHDHVSEMSLRSLEQLCVSERLQVEQKELMSVMSGSEWFDRHVVLLSALLLVEALHQRLRRESWAHSVMLRLRKS